MPNTYDKLIAVDLDGTLLQSDNSVSPENLAAIERAVGENAMVVVVTGRPYVSAESIARRFHLPPVPLVTFNGAVIRNPDDGEILHQQLVPSALAAEVLMECLDQDLHLHFYVDDVMYVNRNDSRAQMYCERTEMECLVVPDMREFVGCEAIKLLTIDEPEVIAKRLNDYKERWSGRLYVTRSMPEYIEFMSVRASKGIALDWLIDFFGVPHERTLAIGDGMNDFPLLEHAEYSVAMPDGDDSLKKTAQFVPRHQATGVAEGIDWFLDKIGSG